MKTTTKVANVTRFLSVLDFDHATLEGCLDLAASMKSARAARRSHVRPLEGRHVALLFEKPSLRTISTFEIAKTFSNFSPRTNSMRSFTVRLSLRMTRRRRSR